MDELRDGPRGLTRSAPDRSRATPLRSMPQQRRAHRRASSCDLLLLLVLLGSHILVSPNPPCSELLLPQLPPRPRARTHLPFDACNVMGKPGLPSDDIVLALRRRRAGEACDWEALALLLPPNAVCFIKQVLPKVRVPFSHLKPCILARIEICRRHTFKE